MLVRVRLEYLVVWIVVLLAVGILVWLPPYEKLVYAFAPMKGAEDIETAWVKCIGYRGTEEIPRLTRTEDMFSMTGPEVQVIETDVKKMQATGVYRDLSTMNGYEESKLRVFFDRLIGKSYGQFYIVGLESGENVLVLLNDEVFHIPWSGKVALPIGRGRTTNSSLFSGYDVYEKEHSSMGYFDCASRFVTGPEMNKLRLIQKIVTIGACFIFVPLMYFVIVIVRVLKK